jgi:microcystin-dependent protein
MAVTFTTNKWFAEPTVGTETGTWGPYVNRNCDLLDTMLGGFVNINLTNVNVQLSSAQYQCGMIGLAGALTGNVQLTFPGGIGGFWIIQNGTTNSSAFAITLTCTDPGALVQGLPPGQISRIYHTATNIHLEVSHQVGQYWDHAGSSVPAWISNCTVPPYLNCDGSVFNAATYPTLNAMLNGNVLPDARGRSRFALNQGTGRITTGNGGVDGNTLGAAGGADTVTLLSTAMPAHNHGVTDPGHTHTIPSGNTASFSPGGGGYTLTTGSGQNTGSHTTGISLQNAGGGGAHSIMAPSYVGGITLVRAG